MAYNIIITISPTYHSHYRSTDHCLPTTISCPMCTGCENPLTADYNQNSSPIVYIVLPGGSFTGVGKLNLSELWLSAIDALSVDVTQ